MNKRKWETLVWSSCLISWHVLCPGKAFSMGSIDRPCLHFLFFWQVTKGKGKIAANSTFTQPLFFICTQTQQRGEVARCMTTDNMLNWLSGNKNKMLAKVEISDLYWDSILFSRDLQEKNYGCTSIAQVLLNQLTQVKVVRGPAPKTYKHWYSSGKFIVVKKSAQTTQCGGTSTFNTPLG